MHARRLDALDGLHRAGELALQGALVVDVLDEGGGAEGVGLVEDLIAHAGRRQIVLGQRHAQLGDLVGRNQDGTAIPDVILDGHAVQLGGDGGGVARFQPGEEDGLGRLGDGARNIKEEGGQNGGDAGHHAEPRRANRLEKIRQDVPRKASEKFSPLLLGKHCRLQGKIWLKETARADALCALFCLTGCLRLPCPFYPSADHLRYCCTGVARRALLNLLRPTISINYDTAGPVWPAARPGRSDRWHAARPGIPPPSAYSACRHHPG